MLIFIYLLKYKILQIPFNNEIYIYMGVFVFQYEVEKKLLIKKNLQRLFFSGKQLEDDYYLDNYNINFNDIILLIIKTADNVKKVKKNTSANKKNKKEKKISEEGKKEEELEEVESLYYKIGDAVDCIDKKTGAWFEAIIKNIYKKGAEVLYKILWASDNVISPDMISEASIRPRARYSIPFNKLSVGQRVMINYDIDNPKKIGLWFDFTITEIVNKRKVKELVGQLHVSRYVPSLSY